MIDIDHLSYSSISTYQMCPRSWRYHYLDKIQMPTSPALIFGSAFHNTVEEHVKTAFATERVPIVDRWHRHWGEQLEQDICWGSDTPEDMAALGEKMFSDPDTIALVDSLEPLVIDDKPLIEQYVVLQVPGVPVPIIGYIDMIEVGGVPCDFKTSARSWNQDQANSEMQPTFYLAALNQAGAPLVGDEDGFSFRHYVFVKTKKPQVQIWESYRTIGQMFWLFGLIRETWEAISAGAFPPNTTTFKCSPRYCEYWGICRGAT